MGLISGRLVIIVIIICVALGWSIANGLVTWNASDHACYGGKSIQPVGKPLHWLWVGKLQLSYQPWQWDCDKDHAYDPKQYHVVDGVLVPVNQSSSVVLP